MRKEALNHAALASFLQRSALVGPQSELAVYDNPTEEIRQAAQEGRGIKLYRKGAMVRRVAAVRSSAPKQIARLEENYLFASRRFPSSANNTIGSGALAVAQYPFFNKAAGDDGSGAGFPTGFVLDLTLTNLQVANQIPQGTSFVFNQIGVSFNSDAGAADVNQMLEACALQFSKAGGQFTLDHGPLKMWPGGMGSDGFAATAVGGSPLTIQSAHNGSADIRAVRNLRIARVLKEKETFNYTIIIPRTTKAQNGAAFALSDFVVVTIWLWGGQKNVIPT